MSSEPRHLESSECIQDCLDCFRSCYETAVHCLGAGGRHAELAHLRILDECARICRVAAESMMSHSEYEKRFCAMSAELCSRCADECDSFTDDAVMKRCAETCRRCARSCRQMSEFAPVVHRARPTGSERAHPPLM